MSTCWLVWPKHDARPHARRAGVGERTAPPDEGSRCPPLRHRAQSWRERRFACDARSADPIACGWSGDNLDAICRCVAANERLLGRWLDIRWFRVAIWDG